MKKLSFLALVFIMTFAWSATALAQNADKFIDNLMSKMTLEEKIGQLNLQPAGEVTTGGAMDTNIGKLVADGGIGSILNLSGKDKIRAIQQIAVEKSRLGIPLLVGLDVIHGYRTIFPVPLAQSCSWDIDAIETGARIAAEECSCDGIGWTYSPMVDIARDARWGRIMEGNGEDPYLGSLIGAALVRGYQGDMTGKHNILACLKHFALYGAAEAGRDYNTVDMSHLQMFNSYFPPYKAAVEAGVASVMTSFNIVDGQHATANPWLVNHVLRDMWGFNGFVVTDYASIAEMTAHGFGNLKDNGAKAMKAGTDMDMCSLSFLQHCKDMLAEGLITEKDIDQACRRVLEAKYKLGLFDDPYKHCSMSDKEQKKHTFTAEHRKVARDMAVETFVLLKNEGNILPLKKAGKIALIGPNANTTRGMLGSWCVTTPADDAYPSLKTCMEEVLKGKGELLYAQGCNFSDDERQKAAGNANTDGKGFITEVDNAKAHDEAMAVAAQADVIVCAMGEGAEWTGESHSRTSLDMPEVQMRLLKDLASLGKPIVLLNFAGRPTVMNWEKENIPAIMNVWFGGTEMGGAICDVIFGEKSPCGHLTTSMPKSVGQEPLYYNHLNTGRPVAYDNPRFQQYSSNYFEVSNGPAFPFGFGLSYTTFDYNKMVVEGEGTDVTVKVNITNSGKYDAYEVVQLYIHDIAATYARPVKELKGFERVFLKAGETKTVTLKLNKESFSYYDFEGNLMFEPGDFEIMVGSSSADEDLMKTTITL